MTNKDFEQSISVGFRISPAKSDSLILVTHENGKISLPSGRVQVRDPDLRSALLREFIEETGLSHGLISFLLQSPYVVSDFSGEKARVGLVYDAKLRTKFPEQNWVVNDPDGDIKKAGLYSPKHIMKLITKNELHRPSFNLDPLVDYLVKLANEKKFVYLQRWLKLRLGQLPGKSRLFFENTRQQWFYTPSLLPADFTPINLAEFTAPRS